MFFSLLTVVEKIFIEVYELKEYLPVFMHLDYLPESSGHSVYYSLEVPTLLDFQPRSREASKLQDLIQISRILQRVIPEMAIQGISVENIPIEKVTKKVVYECYHQIEGDGIKPLESLINCENPLYNLYKKYSDRSFCTSNSFMRGCIRMLNRTK